MDSKCRNMNLDDMKKKKSKLYECKVEGVNFFLPATKKAFKPSGTAHNYIPSKRRKQPTHTYTHSHAKKNHLTPQI